MTPQNLPRFRPSRTTSPLKISHSQTHHDQHLSARAIEPAAVFRVSIRHSSCHAGADGYRLPPGFPAILQRFFLVPLDIRQLGMIFSPHSGISCDIGHSSVYSPYESIGHCPIPTAAQNSFIATLCQIDLPPFFSIKTITNSYGSSTKSLIGKQNRYP